LGNSGHQAVEFCVFDDTATLATCSLSLHDALPIFSTGRLLEHWHTGAMTRRARHLDAIEPEAIALMSPKDLGRMGFGPGQKVRVTTRRGEIELKVRSDRDVPQGMVFIPFCFAEAPANVLTNPQLDPFGLIPEFKFCAAKVEPVEG